MTFKAGNQHGILVGFGSGYDYVANGTSDDVTIQQAIDYMFGLGGGVVRLGRGDYKISASIVMKSGVSLIGELFSSKLILDDGVDDHVITVTEGSSNVTMKDFYIDGNGSNQTGTVNGIRVETDSTDSSLRVNNNIHIENIITYDCKNMGIILQGSKGSKVINCKTELGDFGVWVSNSDGALLMGNYILNANLHKLVVAHTCESTKVIGNTVEDTIALDVTGSAIEITYGSKRTTCTGNSIINSSGLGIFVRGSRDNTISGNIINGCGDDGIKTSFRSGFGDSHRQTIGQNIITGCKRGIHCQENRNSIQGNRIFDNNEEGIRLNGGSNTMITGNIITDNGQLLAGTYAGINIISSNSCVIKNNVSQNSDGATQSYGIEKDASTITAEADNNLSGTLGAKNF